MSLTYWEVIFLVAPVLTPLHLAAGYGLPRLRGKQPTMNWNGQQIPVDIAKLLGWNPLFDSIGAGVYGGIVARDDSGKILIGDEWPNNNQGGGSAHNPVHSKGPYLDWSKYSTSNRGFTEIFGAIKADNISKVEELFKAIDAKSDKEKLANLVMTGGARPLHICGMISNEKTLDIMKVLIKNGADVNAKDNYEWTPMNRAVMFEDGTNLLESHGAKSGDDLPEGAPEWDSDEFDYIGPGETET